MNEVRADLRIMPIGARRAMAVNQRRVVHGSVYGVSGQGRGSVGFGPSVMVVDLNEEVEEARGEGDDVGDCEENREPGVSNRQLEGDKYESGCGEAENLELRTPVKDQRSAECHPYQEGVTYHSRTNDLDPVQIPPLSRPVAHGIPLAWPDEQVTKSDGYSCGEQQDVDQGEPSPGSPKLFGTT